jgi:hypothetical protein
MTAPVGADYGPVTGMRNHDDVPVRFSSLAPLPSGALRVVARVFYQSTMREFIEELARANTTDDRGMRLMAIWEQTGRAAPRLVASKTADVTVGPPIVGGADAGTDGGPADAGSDAAAPPGGDPGCGCGLASGATPAGLFVALALAGWSTLGRARRRR